MARVAAIKDARLRIRGCGLYAIHLLPWCTAIHVCAIHKRAGCCASFSWNRPKITITGICSHDCVAPLPEGFPVKALRQIFCSAKFKCFNMSRPRCSGCHFMLLLLCHFSHDGRHDREVFRLPDGPSTNTNDMMCLDLDGKKRN